MISVIEQMEQKLTISAEDRWRLGGMNHTIRIEMLTLIGVSSSYASTSWKKLPYLVKINLSNRKWTV